MVGSDACFGAALAGNLHIALFEFFNFDKAQDAVERRADVVAHAREERTFGRVGGYGLFPFGSSAFERPNEQDDADRQYSDKGGGDGGAVAVEKSERVGFLGCVRCGGVIACGK